MRDDEEVAVTGFVLVVDDNEDARDLLVHCFTEAGFEALSAKEGGEAVGIATYRRPDAIVMDLQRPGMDGYEAAKRIRAVHGPRPYLLAVTAHAGDESRREAYVAGFDDLVTKPIAPAVLVSIVTATLRARQS
jgi:two-component system sensor histidine kinase/response regulator